MRVFEFLGPSSFALTACAAELASIRRRIFGRTTLATAIEKANSSILSRLGVERMVVLSVVALALLFFVQDALITGADRAPLAFRLRPATFALDALDCVGLYLLYHSLSASRFPPVVRAALLIGPGIVYLGALLMPTAGSADVNAYIAYGKLGWAAYAPPDRPFAGSFAPLNAIIATAWNHLEPSPYGPLMIGIDRLVAGPAASIGQARIEFRLLNVAALAACAFALRRLAFGAPAIAMILLDPEIVLKFVVDAHNDILAVAAILVGMALYNRSKVAAFVVASVAGGLKVPYMVPALLAASSEIKLPRRLTFATLIAVGTAVLSIIGGIPYYDSLACTTCAWKGHFNAGSHAGPTTVLHVLGAAGAIVAVVVVVVYRRTLWTAALLFALLFASGFPWYVIAGLPYAALDRRGMAAFAIGLPLWMYLFRVASQQ